MRRPQTINQSQRDPLTNITRIRQMRVSHRARYHVEAACLIVEGETDVKLYNKFIDRSTCFVLFVNGKENALRVQRRANSCNNPARAPIPGILTIVDQDHDYLKGQKDYEENVLATDTHDHETMILVSPALENMLTEIMPPDRLQYLDDFAAAVRRSLLDIGVILGWVHYAACTESNLGWPGELNVGDYVDKAQICLMVDRLCTKIGIHWESVTELKTQIEKHLQEPIDPWVLCVGHHLVDLLITLLPFLLEKHYRVSSGQLRFAEVKSRLRTSYEYSFFQESKLYRTIRAWECANPSYTVCK